MSDPIERQAAIDALGNIDCSDGVGFSALKYDAINDAVTAIKALPPAQPEPEEFEWCHTCREYDQEKHCCHRWTKVIRKTVDDMKAAQPRWIPCSRELPKPNEEDGNGFYKAYLVQDGRWMDVARWDGKYWIAWGYSTVLLNVVAWMPLPIPYREGEQDNG